jgi:hypothetical protein
MQGTGKSIYLKGKSIYPFVKFRFHFQDIGKSIYMTGKSIYPVEIGFYHKISIQNQELPKRNHSQSISQSISNYQTQIKHRIPHFYALRTIYLLMVQQNLVLSCNLLIIGETKLD